MCPPVSTYYYPRCIGIVKCTLYNVHALHRMQCVRYTLHCLVQCVQRDTESLHCDASSGKLYFVRVITDKRTENVSQILCWFLIIIIILHFHSKCMHCNNNIHSKSTMRSIAYDNMVQNGKLESDLMACRRHRQTKFSRLTTVSERNKFL